MADEQIQVSLEFQAKSDNVQANIKALDSLLERLTKEAAEAEKELKTLDAVSMEKKKKDIEIMRGLIDQFSKASLAAKNQLASIDKTVPLAANQKLAGITKTLSDVSLAAVDAGEQFAVMGSFADEAAAKAAAAAEEADELRERMVRETKQQIGDIRSILGQVSLVSGILFAPAALSAQNYVSNVGRATEETRAFLAAQQRIGREQQEFGKKATAALTPYYELLADITDILNDVPDEVFQAGIAAGAALALVGVVGTLVTQITTFTSVAGLLIARLNATSAVMAAGGVGNIATYAGVGLGAAAIGTGAGILGVRAIGQATDNDRLKDYNLDDALETLRQVLIIGADQLLDAVENAVTVFVYLKAEFQKFALDLQDKLKGVLDAFQQMIDGLENVLLETEIFGKNIGEALGIERNIVSGRRGGTGAGGEAPLSLEDKKRQIDQDAQDALDTVGQFFNDVRQKAVDAFTGDDAAPDLADQFGQEALDAYDTFIQDLQTINNEAFEASLSAQEQYHKDIENMTEQFQERQLEAQEQYNKQTAKLEEQQQKRLADLQTQAAKDIAKADEDYSKSRAEAEIAYQEEEIKRTERYNRDRVRAEEKARMDLRDAAARLDARAVLDILRNRDMDRKTAGEDFDIETKERKEAHADQLDDLREQNETFKRERQEQLREQLKDQRDGFREQMRERAEAHRDQLAADRKAYEKQKSQRAEAYREEVQQIREQANRQREVREKGFQQQVKQLLGYQEFEASARAQHYQRLAAQLNAYIASVGLNRPVATQTRSSIQNTANQASGGRRPSYQQFDRGGYHSDDGLYYGHKEEFTTTRTTTKLLEQIAGGKLTQNRLLELAAGGGLGASPNISINISGAGDPLAIAGAVKRELLTIMRGWGKSQ